MESTKLEKSVRLLRRNSNRGLSSQRDREAGPGTPGGNRVSHKILVFRAKPKRVLGFQGFSPCPCSNILGQGWERSWDSQEAAGGAGTVTAIPRAAVLFFFSRASFGDLWALDPISSSYAKD